jgi:hypothetical protein
MIEADDESHCSHFAETPSEIPIAQSLESSGYGSNRAKPCRLCADRKTGGFANARN